MFTSGRSRTLDSFYAGNRRNPYKTWFSGFVTGDSIAWKIEKIKESTKKVQKWEKRWQQAEEIEAFKHKFKIEYSKAINAIVL